jgi:hypothetical protein
MLCNESMSEKSSARMRCFFQFFNSTDNDMMNLLYRPSARTTGRLNV